MSGTDRLAELADAGVSIWLDDLSRERLNSGNLAELIRDHHVVGVTTNPVFRVLEDEGVDKFAKSWLDLLDTVEGRLENAKR